MAPRVAPLGRFLVTLALASLTLAAAPTRAADPPPAATLGPATPTPASTPIPSEHASARATMRTFLDAVVGASVKGDEALINTAAACLDLSQLPLVTPDAARDLAIKLKEVIDRIEFVVYDKIPDHPGGPPWTFTRIPSLGAEITIAPNARGEWLFSPATVAQVETIFRYYEAFPKVAGVGAGGIEMSPSLWLRSKFPPEFHARGFLLEHWQWISILVLAVVAWVLGRLIRLVLQGPALRFLSGRQMPVPHRLVERFLEPIGFVAMGILWVVGLRYLALPPEVSAIVVVILKFLAALGVIRIAFRTIDIATHILKNRADRTASRFDDLLVPFFDKSAKVVIVALGIVFVADVFGVSPASLLAGLGIGGLALALAAQDTVKNLFGSITIIFDRPFEIGDDVKIGADISGTVEAVGFRSTRLRTFDHTLLTVPNGNLISANIDNLGKRTFHRYRAIFTLHHDTPPAQAVAFCAGLEALVQQHTTTRKVGFSAGVQDIGPSGLEILFICHFIPKAGPEQVAARQAFILDVLALAGRLGIVFAYPTQSLHLHRAPDRPARTHHTKTRADAPAAPDEGRSVAQGIAQVPPPAAAPESADLTPGHRETRMP